MLGINKRRRSRGSRLLSGARIGLINALAPGKGKKAFSSLLHAVSRSTVAGASDLFALVDDYF
jgi:hypothetical protein